VHRVRVRVVGIFVKALRERFQAAALCLEVRRVLIARTREANVAGWREAERVQVSLIKQEEVGEPLASLHILANVVPVVKAHRPQAFSSVPQRLVHFRLYCRHPPRVRERIGTILYHESVTGAILRELVSGSTGRANNAWVNEVSSQSPAVAVIDVGVIYHWRWRIVVALRNASLNTGDVAVFVVEESQADIVAVAKANTKEICRSLTVVIDKLQTLRRCVFHRPWHGRERVLAERVEVPRDP